MRRILFQYIIRLSKIGVILLIFCVSACEKFLTPDQLNIAKTNEIFQEWDEYRSAGLGLYALQQDLVDQLFILGEVRADMLKLTQNATSELEEVANFEFNPDNEFINPKGFYRLIAASNALDVKIMENNSDIFGKLDSIAYSNIPENERNYIGLYGEVLCMRAWAYFNLVRIYGEVPYFPAHLATEEEINEYVLSDVSLTFLDLQEVVDTFSLQLEQNIGEDRVGVNYNSEGIDDPTWSITSWNKWAYYSLMGQMFLFTENYAGALEYFEKIVYNNRDFYYLNMKQYDAAGHREDHRNYRPINNDFWTGMFSNFDLDEHILAAWFNKERKQQNRLQYFLSNDGVNIYALAPTGRAIQNWETQWHDATFVSDAVNPENRYMVEPGVPGDFIRGHGASYAYIRGGTKLTLEDVDHVLELKRKGLFQDAKSFMTGVDTVVYKYSMGKDPFDLDAHYSFFRAGPLHLYYAEALNATGRFRDAEDVLNRGISFGTSSVSGVRRRAYLAHTERINTDPIQNLEEGLVILDVMPIHDPFTNQIVGFNNYAGQQIAKTFLRDSLIIRERALECAWEGERFYDLIRIAERWDNPAYLANKVASKYPAHQREHIRALLMNKENWYLPYFKAYQ